MSNPDNANQRTTPAKLVLLLRTTATIIGVLGIVAVLVQLFVPQETSWALRAGLAGITLLLAATATAGLFAVAWMAGNSHSSIDAPVSQKRNPIDDVDSRLAEIRVLSQESSDRTAPSAPQIAATTPTDNHQNTKPLSVAEGRRQVEDLMALTQFLRAEQLAQKILQDNPLDSEADALLDTVRREANAFRKEHQSKLLQQVVHHSEHKQWTNALIQAQKLLETYPASNEAQEVKAILPTIENNARLEEVRRLGKKFTELLPRRRYSEALKIAEDIVKRFPDTQAAKDLIPQLPRLRRRV